MLECFSNFHQSQLLLFFPILKNYQNLQLQCVEKYQRQMFMDQSCISGSQDDLMEKRNLLSIISFRLLKTNLPLGEKIEQLSKRYGLASYIILIVFIVALNANTNFEHSSSLLSWMAPR